VNGLKVLKNGGYLYDSGVNWTLYHRAAAGLGSSGEIQCIPTLNHSISPRSSRSFLCDRAMRSRFPSKTRPQVGLLERESSRNAPAPGAATISNPIHVRTLFPLPVWFLSRPFPFLFQLFSFNLIPDRLYVLDPESHSWSRIIIMSPFFFPLTFPVSPLPYFFTAPCHLFFSHLQRSLKRSSQSRDVCAIIKLSGHRLHPTFQ
jgi:hypothetical protein